MLLCPWNCPGKKIGVGCHFLPQRIFPTQESNLSILHCRQILYQLSHKGSPFNVREAEFIMFFQPKDLNLYLKNQSIQGSCSIICIKAMALRASVYYPSCGLPRWLNGKWPPANVGDMGSIPGWGRSLAERNGYPLQYSCLENSMDRGA